MSEPVQKLPPAAFKAGLAAINAWQQAPDAAVACPVCGALDLVIVDRSARPYTAWFKLTCAGCGLDDTITYALGGGGSSWS
jgi:hypothetical protein